MFTAFIFMLFLAAAFLYLVERKRIASWMFFFATMVFCVVGSGLPALYLVNMLQQYGPLTNPGWQTKNAIVVLGSGSVHFPFSQNFKPSVIGYSRINEGARLYYLCKSESNRNCKLIVSGGDPLRIGKSESEVYKAALMALRIPEQDILVETNSRNTYENARNSKRIIDKLQPNYLVLVTSNTHMQRSLAHFEQFQMQAQPSAADYTQVRMSFLPTGQHFANLDSAVHEYLGQLRVPIYNLLGWNK